MIRSMTFLAIHFRDINADFVKVSISNIQYPKSNIQYSISNIQNAFLSMVENMLLARGKNEVCGAILTDLSKAFIALVMIYS